jgi:putative sterol carrier protein
MATVREIFEKHFPERIAGKQDLANEVNATYQFKLEGEGDMGGQWALHMLAEKAPSITEGETAEAKVTITMAGSDFVDMVTGQQNSQMLFMTGKLKVQGDIGLALKLQRIIA